MTLLLLFAFLSGLVTIAAPCIWPLLPIILSSSATGGHRRPLGITLGIISSFTVLTLSLAYIVRIIPFDTEILRYIAVVIIGILGFTLIIPQAGAALESFVSKLSNKLKPTQQNTDTDGFQSGLLTGLSLGIVWTPCAGPILATIATLAATQAVTLNLILVTLVYVTGVGIPLFFFATAGQYVFTKSRMMNKYTGIIQQVFGVLMILTALSIATGYDRKLQVQLLDAFPSYSSFLNKLESNNSVEQGLDKLKGKNPSNNPKPSMQFPLANGLPEIGPAPEFTGISKWLNTDKPLTKADLKGKVVLIDFWTYTCINCIRTFPYLTSWYEKYKDDGFIIVGVHTPEFEFEKKTENVLEAMKEYKINYPVAQDNDFKTWRAYDNRYWPAHYLLDAKGVIRYTHFGEGKYEETEKNIQLLLEEAGNDAQKELTKEQSRTVFQNQTPETYLGLSRIEYLASPEKPKLGTQSFTVPKNLPVNFFAYEGEWILDTEYAEVGESGAKIIEHFDSKKVFLVITPSQAKGRVQVLLDGKPIKAQDAGEDVVDGYVQLDNPRLYTLVDLETKGNHVLTLIFDTVGTQTFAFTFGG